mmetsp:Transcript_13339/g.42525  ORF Transcript_13339/g.42525 Transcript_13339/m.42525 type:complete len:220 (+) Transcript_13339:173-832(+)
MPSHSEAGDSGDTRAGAGSIYRCGLVYDQVHVKGAAACPGCRPRRRDVERPPLRRHLRHGHGAVPASVPADAWCWLYLHGDARASRGDSGGDAGSDGRRDAGLRGRLSAGQIHLPRRGVQAGAALPRTSCRGRSAGQAGPQVHDAAPHFTGSALRRPQLCRRSVGCAPARLCDRIRGHAPRHCGLRVHWVVAQRPVGCSCGRLLRSQLPQPRSERNFRP